MTIRSHPLFPGSDGKLEDTKEEDDPDSAEAKFAADMTSAYDEISLHFPMFARLRELAKLQFLGLFLKFVLQDLKDSSENVKVPQEVVSSIRKDAQQSHERQVNSILTDLERQIGVWPSADDYNAISSARRKVEASMNQYVSRSVLEREIKTVFQQNDRQLVSDLVNIFLRLTKHSVSRSTMDTYVRAWLQERNSRHNCYQAKSNLLSLIVSHIPLPTEADITKVIKEHCYNDYRAFNSHLNSLKPTPKKINPDACDWVPAALYQEETENYYSLCYGGVLLCPDLQPGYVYPLSKATQVVNPYRTRMSRPPGHAAPPSRPYHTSAYHAPEFLAQSAVTIVQPKANADGAGGSSAENNNGTSGNDGTSGGSSGNSGSGGGEPSAHPGAAAGGRGGGGDSSDEESNDEVDYEEEEEEESTTSYRSSVKRVQNTGTRSLHHMVQHVSGSDSPSFKLTDIQLSFVQVLNQNRTIDSIKGDGKQRFNESHLKSKPLKFDQYFRYEVTTIKSLKSNQEFEIPRGITPHEITKTTDGVIYCIYCKSTGKMYVGMTKGPTKLGTQKRPRVKIEN
uniref:GIY-YIG domain-containing protein n=1 Tax=Amphimedon queenslandica TaxID=400682 RepID=A0A1X7V295_AMPQE